MHKLLDRFGVSVHTLDASWQTLAGRQVDVLQRGHVLQQPRQGLHVDGASAQIKFPEQIKKNLLLVLSPRFSNQSAIGKRQQFATMILKTIISFLVLKKIKSK